MKFADIILPLPLAQFYTYAVPSEMENRIAIGMRVVVHFGSRRFYTGIVKSLHNIPPQVATVKSIELLLDDAPIVLPNQFKFWEFIVTYYRAFWGDVYKAAVPSALKLESETVVALSEDATFEMSDLSDSERQVCDMLAQKKELSVGNLSKTLDVSVVSVLRSLMAKGIIYESEELRNRYRPRIEAYAVLNENYVSEDALKQLFDDIKRAKKQVHLLKTYLEMCYFQDGMYHPQPIERKELLNKAQCTLAIYKGLENRGVFQTTMHQVSRLEQKEVSASAHSLIDFQQTAYEQIKSEFEQRDVVLLHGVTSSGKTELYIHLIEETLAQGKQVLYLVPEIALTTQLSNRLQVVFGNNLVVYHSRFSDAERVEAWQQQLTENPYKVVLGARSSVFLPYQNLGLVIVDEEHDTSYKQFDPAPRYHAKNAALMLAKLHGAKTLLGSATPSIETYCNCLTNKYGLVQMTQRYEAIELPKVVVVDIREAYRKKCMEGHFSDTLLEAMRQTLDNGEQIILFQNRRGYAPYVECKQCAWVPRCPNCDVNLTYHKAFNKLTCHYCGYTEPVPVKCPDCKSDAVLMKGFGTEKVEDEVKQLFPNIRVARMDLDTTQSKRSLASLLDDFELRKVDILVGTQMVTKGLDFENVGLVGILNADNLLNYPDFRSYERAFQMLVQVSGRSGRKYRRGLVMLQTSQPNHPIIKQVVANDYRAFFDMQMVERQMFNFPPYCRLIQIVLKHRKASVVNSVSRDLANILRRAFGKQVLGPDNPPVGRVQQFYIKHILLKVDVSSSFEKAKKIVDQAIADVQSDDANKSLIVYMDVDPM
ncbi:MAG TPA: primosomal protein N' [Paludibacteraceae bacterium]|nr:primosomal protein N' [Paludibacteraceae bacterium]